MIKNPSLGWGFLYNDKIFFDFTRFRIDLAVDDKSFIL